MTEQQVNAVLAPKVEYTAEQHEIARLRYLLERLHDSVFDIYFHSNSRCTHQWSPKETADQIKLLATSGDGADDLADALTLYYGINFEAFRQEAETGIHSGDCTAVCCSCSRCQVEDFYQTNTAPWSKQIGSALQARSYHLYKERTANESTTPSGSPGIPPTTDA